MNDQIYISLLSTSSCFYKVLFRAKKTDARLNKTLKLKFILMLFDSVYPPRPSDTVTKYTVYSPILLAERLFEWYWVLFCYFILWLAKPGSKMHCILLFEIEYSFELVSTNPLFLSHPSDTKILFGGSYSKNPKNLKTYVFGRLFFDMQISRSCH